MCTCQITCTLFQVEIFDCWAKCLQGCKYCLRINFRAYRYLDCAGWAAWNQLMIVLKHWTKPKRNLVHLLSTTKVFLGCLRLDVILLGQGFLAVVLLLLCDAAHQLKGERSSTGVPLHGPDRLTEGVGQRNAALCLLGGWNRKQSLIDEVTQGLCLPVSLLVYPYLGFFVIGMVPVVHVTFLQNKVSAMPHPISTDQLKHRLGARVRVNFLTFKKNVCFDNWKPVKLF